MEKNKSFPIVQILFLTMAYLVAFLIGKQLLGTEFPAVVKWWGTLAALGLICYPLTSLVFSEFHDGGWLFSKAIGVALSGWLLWMLSSIHLLKFTRTNCLMIAGVLLAGNIAVNVLTGEGSRFSEWKRSIAPKQQENGQNKLTLAMWYELLFLLLLFVACYIKCFKPQAYGTEKFMDYGFMTSLMRTEYMPPEDFWFSGTKLNYYYLGQYFATFLTKLSGVTVNDGYNLALAMLLAFCFMMSYSIVYELTKLASEKKKGQFALDGAIFRVLPHFSGLTAGTAVTFAGSMHYPIYAKLVPLYQKWKGLEQSSYWFPDATRYIGYNPETNDKTIHEFPAYSFVLGDLHAHVVNIMFVLTVLGILLAWLLYRKNRMEAVKEGRTAEKLSTLVEVFHPAILFLGFFLGLFQTTNYWDFPIYFIVSGAIILFSNAVVTEFKKDAVMLTALHAAVIIILMLLVPMMFNVQFDSMAKGIGLCRNHTPFYQFAVLWGLPVFVLVTYLVSLLPAKKDRGVRKTQKTMPALFGFINSLELPDLYALTIGLCAAGLILLPELIYVVDIYSGDYKRANTMFKFTYQAFIMFGLMMGYVIPKFLILERKAGRFVCGVAAACLLAATVGYTGTSVESWFGDIKDKSRFQSLDSAAFIETESETDAEAIDWLNENVKGRPVVLEAPGDSYTYYERVSVATGLPTVIGWHTHEWLWKDSLEKVDARVADVKTIYTSTDMELVKNLLGFYNVEYVYIGGQEYKKYKEEGINISGLRSLGTVAFENDGVTIIKTGQN